MEFEILGFAQDVRSRNYRLATSTSSSSEGGLRHGRVSIIFGILGPSEIVPRTEVVVYLFVEVVV